MRQKKKLAENFEVTFNKNDDPIPYEELIKLANQYDGMAVSGWDKFDENFFVKTIEIHKKDEVERREHFKLFELEKLLDSQTESVIYCPDEKERALVN